MKGMQKCSGYMVKSKAL